MPWDINSRQYSSPCTAQYCILLENDLETQITNCPTRTVDLSSSSKIQNDLNYIFQLQREFFTFFNCPQISSIFLLFSQVKLQFLNSKDILVWQFN